MQYPPGQSLFAVHACGFASSHGLQTPGSKHDNDEHALPSSFTQQLLPVVIRQAPGRHLAPLPHFETQSES